jgi:hypothetical protein
VASSTHSAYHIVPIAGLQRSEVRAVVFLSSDMHRTIDAATVFAALKEKPKRTLLDRFDYWVSGGRQDKYFHGWPNQTNYKECFVFKLQSHRLYGFLCNPQPIHRPRFQLCVLCLHAFKKEWETDFSELDRTDALRKDADVMAAVKSLFRD